MSKGSMKILRPLPDAPTPTKPVRTKAKERIDWATIDDDPITSDLSARKSSRSESKPKSVGAAGRELAMENARKRAMPIIELYKNGATVPEIATATGLKERTINGIIGRYIKSGKVAVTPSHEDKRLAELYNSGMSYNDMAGLLQLTGGALSSKIHKIRRMGLIGNRTEGTE